MESKRYKQILQMYKLFGQTKNPDAICRDCRHLHTYTAERKYYKCSVYGDTRSDATDWRIGWIACGMYGKPYTGKPVIETVKHAGRKKPEEPIEGQLSLFSLQEFKEVEE